MLTSLLMVKTILLTSDSGSS